MSGSSGRAFAIKVDALKRKWKMEDEAKRRKDEMRKRLPDIPDPPPPPDRASLDYVTEGVPVVRRHVASLSFPIKLSAMEAMNTFIEAAYGPECVCEEETKGWLKVTTLDTSFFIL